ncbi:hypothetical protein [Alkalicoccus daliensis]|uniref:Uncharacterized protein n=1 Tax=Alkalicoccus daliensis TaxID=745820 RepID=A0A1H0E563_9BACI|nr:hypothetical protein [Alkalicoccus daliensis]SDN77443.1 hypothetical protein SAMN04488053_103207 [Alkalicoccus daliensis]
MSAKEKKKPIRTIVQQMSKKELEEFLIEAVKKDRHLGELLRLFADPPEDETESSRKLIQMRIKKAGDRFNFIPRGRAREALSGAREVMETAISHLERRKYVQAAELVLVVIEELTDVLQHMDDSDGDPVEVVYQGFNIIEHIVNENLSGEVQQVLFQKVMATAVQKRFSGMKEWRNALLFYLVPLTIGSPERKKNLYQVLMQLKKGPGKGSSEKYSHMDLLRIESVLIKVHEGKEAYTRFLWKHKEENIEFLYEILDEKITQGKGKEALQLIEQSKKPDLPAGYLAELQKFQLHIYNLHGETGKERSLLKKLILQNQHWVYSDNFYFEQLKKTYSKREWPAAREQLLSELTPCSHTYLEICKEEKETDRLLECCKEKPQLIEVFSDLLKFKYAEEVKALFETYILKEAARANTRSNYKKICYRLRGSLEANGAAHTKKLIQKLEQAYPNKPAFMDELNKLKQRI